MSQLSLFCLFPLPPPFLCGWFPPGHSPAREVMHYLPQITIEMQSVNTTPQQSSSVSNFCDDVVTNQ